MIRSRWAAIGAAVAVSVGAGGLGIANATSNDGERAIYQPIEPCRMVDTRPANEPNNITNPLGAQAFYAFDLTEANGDCTALPNATALVVNVTALNQTAPTFLSLVPGTLPAGPYNASSNLNPVPGEPPTPNAVNVDLDNSTFSIYNNAGTVDVIIDIVGYFEHHTHDDRYYTKAIVDQLIIDATPTIDAYTKTEVDNLLADKADTSDVDAADDALQSQIDDKADTSDVYSKQAVDDLLAGIPWSVSVPVSQSYWSGIPSSPEWNIASGGSSGPGGLALTEASYGRFWNGFTVPAQHEPGDPIKLMLTWAADEIEPTSCDYYLELNWIDVTRPGTTDVAAEADFEHSDASPFSFPATKLSTPANLSEIQGTFLTITGDLRPGDHVQFALNRDPADSNDTCVESLYLTGLTATPG